MNRLFRRLPLSSSKAMVALTLGVALNAAIPVTLAALPSTAAAQAGARQEYVLGSGDALKITVYQSPDLSLETRVSESGAVSYPLLGQVRLGGLTISQAEKAIADGLRSGNFLKSPQVSILVTQVRGNQANALGMVGHPGRFPIEVAGMRLSDLLAMAGGISPTGADIVTFSGTRGGQPFRRTFDIAAITAGSSTDDPVIQNGDTVFVDRMPQVYIYGEVQKPGVMRLERNMTVIQALAAGGGLTLRGTEKGVTIHRTQPNGRVEVIEPTLTDPVRDGDVIRVRQSLF